MNSKRIISVAAFSLAFLTAFLALPVSAASPFSRSLQKGVRGNDVSELQRLLAEDTDIYPEGLVTGYFGSLTENAVKRFQKKYGIETVGIVGPKTQAQFNVMITAGAGASGNVPKGLLKKFGSPITTSDTTTATTSTSTSPGGSATTTPVTEYKITICHYPGGNPANKHTISVGLPALNAHLTHGDSVGACGGTGGGGNATTTPDTTAPVISSLISTSTTSGGTEIRWTTNELADSTVVYATTSPVNLNVSKITVSNASLVLTHSLSLTGLSASTTYYYLVTSKDSSGNNAISSESSFVTLL